MTATESLWPRGFDRIPEAEWTKRPVEELALNYDTVEQHGWYANLDLTVSEVGEYARSGDILIDYSGGTGILARRLFDRLGEKPVGVVLVDSSPKFLRLALEKFRDEPRVAFRRIRYLKDEGRLERVDEVLGEALLERGVDGVISTNAIHLYFDLDETVEAWHRVLERSGRIFVQSGNILDPDMPDDEWIIDQTVELIHEAAARIVREDPAFATYREHLDDDEHMEAHGELRRRYFLPVRPLGYYLDVLRDQGFEITRIRRRRVPARVREWYEFLSVYHEGVLGWVGGAEKITGTPPPEKVVEDRLELMRRAIDGVFGGAEEFGAHWTYVTGEPRWEG